MPNFALNDEARRELAAFLATQKGQAHRGPQGAPWDKPGLARGEAIYRGAGCVTCHGQGGAGGYMNNNAIGGKVPALERAKEGFTRAELVKRIADGVRYPVKADPQGAEPMLYMPAWKEALKPDEIEAVADYLIALKTAPSEDW